MLEAVMLLLVKTFDGNTLGGLVRAGVASLLGAAAGWSGGILVPFLTPEFQTAVGIVASTAVVALWSFFAKKYTTAPAVK